MTISFHNSNLGSVYGWCHSSLWHYWQPILVTPRRYKDGNSCRSLWGCCRDMLLVSLYVKVMWDHIDRLLAIIFFHTVNNFLDPRWSFYYSFFQCVHKDVMYHNYFASFDCVVYQPSLIVDLPSKGSRGNHRGIQQGRGGHHTQVHSLWQI